MIFCSSFMRSKRHRSSSRTSFSTMTSSRHIGFCSSRGARLLHLLLLWSDSRLRRRILPLRGAWTSNSRRHIEATIWKCFKTNHGDAFYFLFRHRRSCCWFIRSMRPHRRWWTTSDTAVIAGTLGSLVAHCADIACENTIARIQNDHSSWTWLFL